MSVRKEMFLGTGLLGVINLLGGLMGLYVQNEAIKVTILLLATLSYFITFIYIKKSKVDKWDDLASQNFLLARKTTMVIIELALPIATILVILFKVQIVLSAWVLMILLGLITIIKVIAFSYFEKYYVA